MIQPRRAFTLTLLTAIPLTSVASVRPQRPSDHRDDLVFAERSRSGTALYVLAAGGGAPTRLTSLRPLTWRCGCRSGDFDDHPIWSPDGTLIAFTRGRGVYVMKADGSGVHRIAPARAAEDFDPAWSSDGALAFVRSTPGGDGYVEEIAIARPDERLVRIVARPSRFGYHDPVWSPDGRRLLYVRSIAHGGVRGATGLFVASARGRRARLIVSAASIASPVWSPDGSRIAFTAQPTPYDASDLYVVELRNGRVTQLTRILSYGAGVFAPRWSPDGGSILFTYAKKSALFRADGPSVFTISPDGHRRALLAANAYALGWSPDGRELLVLDHAVQDGRPLSLAVMQAGGGSERTLVTLDRPLDGLWQAPPSWRR